MAAYEDGSLARSGALGALKAAGRAHRIVYNSASMAGQLAAVESGLAVAALTRCCVPPGLLVLGERQGLPALPAMQVALLRSAGSRRDAATQALYELALQTLRQQPVGG